jgi:hypothetical protein
MFIVGNRQLLESKSQLWRQIFEYLEQRGLTGSELILQSQNNPDQLTYVLCFCPVPFFNFLKFVSPALLLLQLRLVAGALRGCSRRGA